MLDCSLHFTHKIYLFSDVISVRRKASTAVDLLQVSLLINEQTGGEKKKKTEGKGGGERDLWTTRSENEALIHLLKSDWLFR